MILDHITNARLYAGLSPRLQQVFEYLRETDMAALAPGKYELDGDRVFAIVSEYTTKAPGAGKWEAHRRYIDLQYLIRGTEQIWVGRVDRFRQEAYQPEKDFLPLFGEGEALTLHEGDFMILHPDDAHMPSMAAGEPSPVKKVVFKIAVEG